MRRASCAQSLVVRALRRCREVHSPMPLASGLHVGTLRTPALARRPPPRSRAAAPRRARPPLRARPPRRPRPRARPAARSAAPPAQRRARPPTRGSPPARPRPLARAARGTHPTLCGRARDLRRERPESAGADTRRRHPGRTVPADRAVVQLGKAGCACALTPVMEPRAYHAQRHRHVSRAAPGAPAWRPGRPPPAAASARCGAPWPGPGRPAPWPAGGPRSGRRAGFHNPNTDFNSVPSRPMDRLVAWSVGIKRGKQGRELVAWRAQRVQTASHAQGP